MLDRVFKKKEDGSFTDLTRRSRVDRHKAAEYLSRRPRTAPPSGNTSMSLGIQNVATQYRRSLNDSDMSPYCASPDPFRYSSPETITSTSTLSVPLVVPRPTFAPASRPSSNEGSPCPKMMRHSSGGSNELRNPFRNNTSDSVASIGRSNSFDSFAEAEVPVHRIVRAIRPTQLVEAGDHMPQKAAIFTTQDASKERSAEPPSATDVTSDPFTAAHIASPCVTPSPVEEESSMKATEPAPGHSSPRQSRWSILKSPKGRSRDFLHVNIPTGIMSPMRDSRTSPSFWSKA
ncbi:hypothetical protein BN946_scf184798.g23 [Trametes cinnabarina]|uniref:Uncharacterized protein n=1 Tax=Pycnoporus cinnabarinus TaxID=5643 RepID=A0A060SE91_PYCCI|nr:hypothetical protein BN946_scf184798.g23 [Trametes cinnabarina]